MVDKLFIPAYMQGTFFMMFGPDGKANKVGLQIGEEWAGREITRDMFMSARHPDVTPETMLTWWNMLAKEIEAHPDEPPRS